MKNKLMQQQIQSYTITGYMPGIYIIEADKPNGERLQFKFATN